MSVKVDFSGLDKLKRQLHDLSQPRQVTVAELLTPAFMARHTQFGDVDTWWAASGMDSAALATPDPAVDAYVAQSTDFKDWQSLLAQASADYYRQQLDL